MSAPDPPRVRGTSHVPPPVRRSPGPLLVAAAAALVSLASVAAVVHLGWLGADVGRGAEFCEASPAGGLAQPVNTLSNLGFVVAGLAVAWRAGLSRGRLAGHGLATGYAVVVVLLGPGSMAMHATESRAGGELDQLSMYVLAGFAAGYAGVRITGRGPATLLAVLLGVVALCELVARAGTLPLVNNAGNAAFATVLVVAIALEARLRRGGSERGDPAWIAGAVTALVIAFVIWSLSGTGDTLCVPDALLQGHAAWHLLGAAAAYCLYRYWTSAPRAPIGQESAEPAR